MESMKWFGKVIADKDGNISSMEYQNVIDMDYMDNVRDNGSLHIPVDIDTHGISRDELKKYAIRFAKHRLSQELTDDRYMSTLVQILDEVNSYLSVSTVNVERYGVLSSYTESSDIRQFSSLYSGHIKNITAFRDDVEHVIRSVAEKIAPNLSHYIGPLLTAKLIAHAGSLKKLASYPASTIQVLGAEKALFTALKSGKKLPKHGMLYQHPWIHTAPASIRGKLSRHIAAKIAILARVDYYNGEFVADTFKNETNLKIKELKSR